jgi:hypothetical protein
MDLSTNAPGLQFYSGNNLNASLAGKGGYLYPQYGGLALEAQARACFPLCMAAACRFLSCGPALEGCL